MMMLAQAKREAQQRLLDAVRLAFVGKPLMSVPTPFLVLDMDAVERNLEAMRAYCAKKGKALRPHAKMHKSIALSRLQMERGGAVGMCVQKVSEAEVLAGFSSPSGGSSGGNFVHNIFISNEVAGTEKLRRVAALAQFLHQKPDGYLAVAVDSVKGVEALGEALKGISGDGAYIHVLIEIDVGQHRGGCEVSEESLERISDAISAVGGDLLRFEGIHAYHGGAQHIRHVEERARVVKSVVELAQRAKRVLESQRCGCRCVKTVTGAGSGTFFLEGASDIYTELQPGSYLVMDRDYGENGRMTADGDGDGNAHPNFEHALFIQTSVVSTFLTEGQRRGDNDRVVFDAGHKTGAIDCGAPALAPFQFYEAGEESAVTRRHLQRECYVTLANGGDDHSLLRLPLSASVFVPRQGSSSDSMSNPGVVNEVEALIRQFLTQNSVVWLIPGHCDPTFNLHDYVLCVRGLTTSNQQERSSLIVQDVISVDARGCQQ